MTLNKLAKLVHGTSVAKGWWAQVDSSPGVVLALIHSEVSEALEEWRNGHGLTETYFVGSKPEGFPTELADVLIRVLDACAAYGIDIDTAVRVKMDYNETRPQYHGGKLV